MDARLIAVIDRLSEDLANLEQTLVHTKELLKELTREERRNGKVKKEPGTVQATKKFLAGQQPQWSGTAPWRIRENDDHD